MVELNEADYNKLLKDANDNRQIFKIAISVLITIVLLIFFFAYGRQFIDLDIQARQCALQNEIAIQKAKTNASIREIEQGDLSVSEYLKWLEVRDELYS